jgi:uncharacterized protein (DUF1778 family)
MTNERICETIRQLDGYAALKLHQRLEADVEQLCHFLAALDLAPAEHHAIVAEYRRRLEKRMRWE